MSGYTNKYSTQWQNILSNSDRARWQEFQEKQRASQGNFQSWTERNFQPLYGHDPRHVWGRTVDGQYYSPEQVARINRENANNPVYNMYRNASGLSGPGLPGERTPAGKGIQWSGGQGSKWQARQQGFRPQRQVIAPIRNTRYGGIPGYSVGNSAPPPAPEGWGWGQMRHGKFQPRQRLQPQPPSQPSGKGMQNPVYPSGKGM